MTTTRKQVPNDRATAVIQSLGEAYNHPHFRQYANMVYRLPMLLHKHGLGQTLAHLQIRSNNGRNSPYTLLREHLTRRLAQLYPIDDDDLLAHLTKMDSRHYRQLATEAREFALVLRGALWAEEQ